MSLRRILPGVGFVVVCREAREKHTMGGFDGCIAVVDPKNCFLVRLRRPFLRKPKAESCFI